MKNLFLLSFLFAAVTAQANPSDLAEKLPLSNEMPAQLENVGIQEHKGSQLPLDLTFTNEDGQQVTLGQYYNLGRPVLLTIVYYSCPNLCNFHLNGLSDVMKRMSAKLGKDFEFVAVSMNHTETPDIAKKKKANYAQSYGVEGYLENAHFLVGSEANIKKLADTVGFQFKWDEGMQQYSHAAVAYVTTPSGIVSRYMYGLEFAPETLRLSMVEASEGKIGSVVDQIMLFCFQYNPAKSKYSPYVFNLVRLGGVIVILLLIVFIVPIWRREKQNSANVA